ncbi:MAG: Rieske (2Fe-2S) protein [Cellvibrionaceae bacterium]
MAFYLLEKLIHLHDGYSRSFSIAGQSLLLVQDQGQRYLLLNQCPHQQAPLDRATIQGGKLQCSLHGMQFDLITGATSSACDERLQFLPIAYDGASIGVQL